MLQKHDSATVCKVFKERNSLPCGRPFKLEPGSHLKGLRWITTASSLWMCCGHQSARCTASGSSEGERFKTKTPLLRGRLLAFRACIPERSRMITLKY